MAAPPPVGAPLGPLVFPDTAAGLLNTKKMVNYWLQLTHVDVLKDHGDYYNQETVNGFLPKTRYVDSAATGYPVENVGIRKATGAGERVVIQDKNDMFNGLMEAVDPALPDGQAGLYEWLGTRDHNTRGSIRNKLTGNQYDYLVLNINSQEAGRPTAAAVNAFLNEFLEEPKVNFIIDTSNHTSEILAIADCKLQNLYTRASENDPAAKLNISSKAKLPTGESRNNYIRTLSYETSPIAGKSSIVYPGVPAFAAVTKAWFDSLMPFQYFFCKYPVFLELGPVKKAGALNVTLSYKKDNGKVVVVPPGMNTATKKKSLCLPIFTSNQNTEEREKNFISKLHGDIGQTLETFRTTQMETVPIDHGAKEYFWSTDAPIGFMSCDLNPVSKGASFNIPYIVYYYNMTNKMMILKNHTQININTKVRNAILERNRVRAEVADLRIRTIPLIANLEEKYERFWTVVKNLLTVPVANHPGSDADQDAYIQFIKIAVHVATLVKFVSRTRPQAIPDLPEEVAAAMAALPAGATEAEKRARVDQCKRDVGILEEFKKRFLTIEKDLLTVNVTVPDGPAGPAGYSLAQVALEKEILFQIALDAGRGTLTGRKIDDIWKTIDLRRTPTARTMSQAVLCRPATGFQQHWGIDLIVQLKNMIDHINIPEDIYDPPLMDDDVERNVGNLFIECLGKCFPAAGNYAEYWQAATRLIQPPLEGGPGVVHMAGGGRKSSRRTRRIQRGGMKRSRNNRSTASGSGSAAGSAPPSPPEAAIGRRGAGGILSAAPSLEGTPSAAAAAAARRYANTLELEEGLALPAPRTRRRRPEGDVLRMIEILQNEINEIKDVLHFYKNIYTLDLRIEFVRNDTVEGKNAKKRIRKNAVISYIQTLFKNLYNRTELPAEGPELEDVVELEEGDLDENTNGLFALDGAATNFALGFSPLWALEQISENCIAHLQQLRSIQPNIVEEIRDDFTILKALSSGDIEEIRPYIDNTVRISDRYIQTSTEFSRSNSRRSFMNSISEATQSWLYVPIFYAIFTDDAAIAANGPIQQKIRLTATFLNRYSAGLWERILASFRARIRPNGIAAYRDMLGVPLRGEYIDADHQDILFESDGLLPLAPDDQALLQQILNNVGRPTAEGVAILQAIDYAIGQEGAALARPLTSGERQAVAAGANLRSARSRGFGVESLGPSAVPLGIPLGSRRAQQMAAAAAAAPLPLAGIAEQNERNEGNNLRRTRKRRGKSTRRKTNR